MKNPSINASVAVILAGGLSRRMFAVTTSSNTQDKGLLPLGASSMLQRVIDRLKPQVDTLVLNANGDPTRFSGFGLPIVADPIEGYVGPLAGVLAGMQWAKANAPNATHIISVSSDAPFLPHDLVARLTTAAANHPVGISLARSQGELHPVIGCWPVIHADDLKAELIAGTRKVLRWTDRHGTHGVDFETLTIGGSQIDPFFNANTQEELAEARRLIAASEQS